MKKYLIIILSMFLLVGCSLTNTPSKSVSELFRKYQSLDDDVVNNLELITEGNSELKTEEDKKDYMKALKLQYKDLKYEIKDEEVDGDTAIVKVDVSVYDFYKAQKESSNYVLEHENEFSVDGVVDSVKVLAHKLKSMIDASDRIEYTIEVNLVKEDNKWVVEEFDKDTLEKIHGTYNYERD